MRHIVLAMLIAVVAAMDLAPTTALAWDAEAHRIIAQLAYERLDPGAKAAVSTLIAHSSDQATPECPVNSFEDASVWPDCVRRERRRFGYLSPMHYQDFPICGPVSKAESCPDGACVVDEIRRALATLKDRNRRAADRVQALEEVTHFVGDLHQPLHASDNHDRGGNSVRVIVNGHRSNLHHVWDTDVVEHAVGRSEAQAVAELQLLVEHNAAAWSRGGIETWLEESHQVAVSYVYGRLHQRPTCGSPAPDQVISSAYLDGAAPIVRQQLARAAVRLALVLNRVLG